VIPSPAFGRPMSAAALRAVSKRFGETLALDGVDLEVRAGEVVALLGPNGAGKTTALSILLGLRRPDAGCAELFGEDPRRPSARVAVGVTPQESGFPPTLRVGEIVDLVRAHFPDPAPSAELLERFGLTGVARRQAGGLSGGERRRLSVTLALAGRPRAIVLDEPTAGLDVESRLSVWREIRVYATGGGTALLTTHHLEEAEALASRVVLLARGRLIAEGTPAELSARARASGLEEAFLALIDEAR
jgi:ABC-2 type transport system ATP-binding protein